MATKGKPDLAIILGSPKGGPKDGGEMPEDKGMGDMPMGEPEGDEGDLEGLKLALDEYDNATDPDERAAAFKRACQACME